MKKLFCLLLAVLLVMPLVAACSDATPEGPQNTDATTTGNSNVVTDEKEIVADVPEIDMNGKVFNIVTDNWWGNSLCINNDFSATAEDSGDRLSDAQFKSRMAFEDRFKCEIREVNFSGPDDSIKALTASQGGNLGAYDIYLARMMYWQTPAMNGQLYDLSFLPYLDFEKPWWDQNSVAELSIGNSLYTAVSDISIQDERWTSCLCFNKELFDTLKLEYPYELVAGGEWTFGNFAQLCEQLTEDADVNGVYNENDKYGLLYQRDMLSGMLMSSGESYAKKDGADIPYITLNSERAQDVILAAMDVLYAPYSCQTMNLTNYIDTRDRMFQNDQALFVYLYMSSVEKLRSMESNFGIVPLPQYESDGQIRAEVSSWSAGTFCIPSDVSGENLEYSCILLEAYGEYAHRYIKPAYDDVLLTGIVARDEESIDMLEIIFDNRMYDIGGCCNFGDLTRIIYLTMTNDRNIASYLKENVSKAEADITNMMKKFGK